VRDAGRHGPISWQEPRNPASHALDRPGMSEDCLTLNVTTPRGDGPWPVMVWFHGGAYSIGSSASAVYANPSLVERGEVVLVTVNYRLGALGYLDLSRYSTTDRPISSNLGLRDQVASLRWVQDNIAAFGGDPSRVTIFGESAGGGAVTTLFATPSAKGLFAAGIAQSSAPRVAEASQAASRAEQFAGLLGENPRDTAAVSRRLATASPAELVEAGRILAKTNGDAFPGTLAFAPVVDGDVLPVQPIDAFEAGNAAPVPLIIGCNAREGALFSKVLGHLIPTSAERIDRMFQLTDPAAQARVSKAYPGLPGKRALADLGGDAVFTYPSSQIAEAHSQHAPTWQYVFDTSTRLLDVLGVNATHGMEIGLVFGHENGIVERILCALGGRRARLAASRVMQDHWTTFAHTRAPLPTWPSYDSNTRLVNVFAGGEHLATDPHRWLRQAWAGYRGWADVELRVPAGAADG
jgi:para-nitrobenzyl esterase